MGPQLWWDNCCCLQSGFKAVLQHALKADLVKMIYITHRGQWMPMRVHPSSIMAARRSLAFSAAGSAAARLGSSRRGGGCSSPSLLTWAPAAGPATCVPCFQKAWLRHLQLGTLAGPVMHCSNLHIYAWGGRASKKFAQPWHKYLQVGPHGVERCSCRPMPWQPGGATAPMCKAQHQPN